MSRTFTIKELNEKIDELIAGYSKDLNVLSSQNAISPITQARLSGKIDALEEIKLELNDPNAVVNVTEKIQESLNIIETNKIIKDGL